jgi:hypothetical protein
MSTTMSIRWIATAAPGLAPALCRRVIQCEKASSSAREGAIERMKSCANSDAAPPSGEISEPLPPRFGCVRPGIVRRPDATDDGVVEDECSHPLRVRRGKKAAHRGCLERGDDRRSLDSSSVEHRANVIHPRLQRRHVADTIGQPSASAIERHHPRVCAETIEHRSILGEFQLHLEVANEAMNKNKIERAFTRDRVRDRNIPATRITNVRKHSRNYRAAGGQTEANQSASSRSRA